MQKKDLRNLVELGLLLVLENLLLTWLGKAISSELIAYLLKSFVLLVTFYLVGQRRLRLQLPFRTKVGVWEQVCVNSLSIFYVVFGCLPLLQYGFTENQSAIPFSLVMALCAGVMEEYICRGVLLKAALGDRIRSHSQLIQAALLSSSFFALAHLANFGTQSLSVTLFQVYYTFAMGLFFAAITLRTQTLWWAMAIHFLIDFSSFLVTEGTSSQSEVSLGALLMWLFVMAVSLFLIRPKKLAMNLKV